MTFCVGIKVESGLVALADSRITSGNQQQIGRKVSIHQVDGRDFFLMTSGLRSVRDKALVYFEEELAAGKKLDKMYKIVNCFADQIRRVAEEDKKMLEESGLVFDLHAMIGGELEGDEEPKLMHLYPQANWVEVTPETPYQVIGESGYGKPILDLAVQYESNLQDAMIAAFLAFDATRRSATDVGFPIDILAYRAGARQMHEKQFQKEDLLHLCDFWRHRLKSALAEIPRDWTQKVLPSLRVA